MAKTRLPFKVPDTRLETEPMTSERAVVGEVYGLEFRHGRQVWPCMMLFLDRQGTVLAAGMDSRGTVAPIGCKTVEAYRWVRK